MFGNLMCRICEGTSNLEMLFKKQNGGLLAMLESIVNGSIELHDYLPKCICGECTKRLEAAYSFRVQCERIETKWRSLLQGAKLKNSVTFAGGSAQQLFEDVRFSSGSISFDAASENYEAPLITQPREVSTNVVSGDENAPLPDAALKKEIKDDTRQKEANIMNDCMYIAKIEMVDSCLDEPDAEITESIMSSDEPLNGEEIGAARILPCEQCGKTFSRLQRLRQHQILHADPKFFSCEECGKSFAENQRLRLHRRLHSNPNLFKCEQCGKVLSDRRCYTRHQKVHTGEFEVASCNFCHRNFTTRSNLKRHMERKHQSALEKRMFA